MSDTGTNDTDERRQLRQEIELIRQSAWSVVVQADRLLVEHYGMPREKRLARSRAERRRLIERVEGE